MKTRRNQPQDEKQIERTLLILWCIVASITAIALFTIISAFSEWKPFSVNFGPALTFLLIAGAFLFCGGILGFLFGIPKSAEFVQAPDETGKSSRSGSSWYSDNTNLEQISDWVTKIIVGLTLTQFNVLRELLHDTTMNVAIGFSRVGDLSYEVYYPMVFGLIIFFAASGFAIGYLWTRINFAQILTLARKRIDEMTKLEQKQEEQKKELSALASQTKVLEETNNTFIGSGFRPMAIVESRDLSRIVTVDEGNDILRKEIQKQLKTPILDPSDPQKGRFGGVAEKNGKRLSVTVRRDPGFNMLFEVQLKVTQVSTDGDLGAAVGIFVHDSFNFPDNVVIANVINGEAATRLVAYEAFTAGAVCEDGTTLELDLNQVPGLPKEFYWK